MSAALQFLPGAVALAVITALILAPAIAGRVSGLAQKAADDGEGSGRG